MLIELTKYFQKLIIIILLQAIIMILIVLNKKIHLIIILIILIYELIKLISNKEIKEFRLVMIRDIYHLKINFKTP